MAGKKHIVFFPGAIYGPILNSVGMANRVKERGERVTFVVPESYKEELEGWGFEVASIKRQPRPKKKQAEQSTTSYIDQMTPFFRDNSREQIPTLTAPSWQGIVDDPPRIQDQVEEIIARLEPDVIVQDWVCAVPAVHTAGVPFVRVVSCVPTEMRDANVPPTFSGLPSDQPETWEPFMEEYRRVLGPIHNQINTYVQEHGCPPLRDLEFMFQSEYLNLYLYPEILDYQRVTPLPRTFHRLDSSVREGGPSFSVPKELGDEGALIYVSMGSMGSLDADLRERLIGALKNSKHKFIISLGSGAPEMELPDNFYGGPFLPQPSVLPYVDLVITHGGNNTVTESVHFGKPMILMSLFWDQHDNAQRVHERGYGIRLFPYQFTESELQDAIDDLLANKQLRQEMKEFSQKLQANPGTAKAADLICRVAETQEPVLRDED